MKESFSHSGGGTPRQLAEEAKLLRRLKRNDSLALASLFDTYGLTLYRFVLRIVKDHDDAEDILQEVFAKLLKKANLIDEDAPHIGFWLMTIARNLALDHLRARGTVLSRQVPLSDHYAIPGSPDAGLISAENARLVASAIQSLRPRQKQVIELAYYYGLTQAEIAALVNQPLGTVKGRTRAAMVQLQNILESKV